MTTLPHPSRVEEATRAVSAGGEFRAAGTDTTARRRAGLAPGPFVDLRGVGALHGISHGADGGVRLGALATLAQVAADPGLSASHPALASTAGALATPQVRAVATVGGNLLQRNRCWYFREGVGRCHQTGGDTCPARSGTLERPALVDLGPCVAPHPSSLATALLAYDASVEVHGRGTLPVGDLYGDGSDPSRDHLLAPGEVLVAAVLPVPVPGERSAHQRTMARAAAEWPRAEVVARLAVTGSSVSYAAVAAGGIARTPLRLTAVEETLVGRPAVAVTVAEAAGRAAEHCSRDVRTGSGTAVLCATVLEALERALGVGSGADD